MPTRYLGAYYCYVPENDPDANQEHDAHAAKRSETKKYKQYHWKSLGKVGRSESEDTTQGEKLLKEVFDRSGRNGVLIDGCVCSRPPTFSVFFVIL